MTVFGFVLMIFTLLSLSFVGMIALDVFAQRTRARARDRALAGWIAKHPAKDPSGFGPGIVGRDVAPHIIRENEPIVRRRRSGYPLGRQNIKGAPSGGRAYRDSSSVFDD